MGIKSYIVNFLKFLKHGGVKYVSVTFTNPIPIRRYLFLAVARDWAELWLRRTWQRVLRL